MKLKLVQIIVAVGMTSPFWRVAAAHEIDTHRALTGAAVRYLGDHDSRFTAVVDSLTSLLAIGAEREDDFIGSLGHGRFFFHFLPPLNDNPPGPVSTVSANCDVINWGIEKNMCTATIFGAGAVTVVNQFTYEDAAGHRDSVQGWEDLGYVIHLLEDMGVPAHTRNDAHPPTNRDLYERLNVGRHIGVPSGGLIVVSSPEELFRSLQTFTSTGFFSRDTVFNPSPPVSTNEDSNYFYNSTRRIAYKGALFRQTRDPNDAEIDEVIAREQFDELAPVIVRYAASLLRFYFDGENPPLPGSVIELGSIAGWFGGGEFTTSPEIPTGIYFSYGYADALDSSLNQVFVFDEFIIPESGATIDLNPADDPQFGDVINAILNGPPPGGAFYVGSGFHPSPPFRKLGAFVDASPIPVPTSSNIQFLRLTVDPFAITGTPAPGGETLWEIPLTQYRITAFGEQ